MAQTKGASKKFDPEAAQAAMNAAAPVEVNTAEVKETATEVKKAAAEVKKAAAKKPAEKKAPAKKAATAKAPAKKAVATKAPAKKTTAAKAPAKKAAAKAAPAEVKANVTVQFRGKEYTMENFVKIVKDIWVYDLKKDLAEFKEVEVYVKPDECMAYYVVNGTEMGGFPI